MNKKIMAYIIKASGNLFFDINFKKIIKVTIVMALTKYPFQSNPSVPKTIPYVIPIKTIFVDILAFLSIKLLHRK